MNKYQYSVSLMAVLLAVNTAFAATQSTDKKTIVTVTCTKNTSTADETTRTQAVNKKPVPVNEVVAYVQRMKSRGYYCSY
ncbi:hypothetical protein ID263_004915 [Escherichia coli]|nr:hypothetical protein [Escherichia coli]EGH0606623.1 hypothetical protein [Escherichia coli]